MLLKLPKVEKCKESVFQLTSSSVQQFVKSENTPRVDLVVTEIIRYISIVFKRILDQDYTTESRFLFSKGRRGRC